MTARTIWRTLLLSLFLALSIAAPGEAQDPPVGGGTDAAAPAIVQDATIRERIDALVIELDGYDEVQVAVRSGIVTMTGEVVDSGALTRLETLITAIDGVLAVENRVVESTDLTKRLSPALQRAQDRLFLAIAYLPLLGIAILVAATVALLGVLLARLRQPWDRLAPNAFIADIFRQIVRLLFIVAGIVVALDILNATALLGTILGAAGLIGLAIGFAVKDTVENFIASVMLSIRQPFAPNDVVEINGDEGKVIRLTSRATILLSLDGNHIRIPNFLVFKSRIVNYTRNPERRFMFTIGVEADSDLAAARALMERTVRELPYTLDMAGVGVWIETLNETGAVFTVTGWIDQRDTSLLRARGEALRLVKLAIEAEGFAIPDTTYRIRLDGATGLITKAPEGPPRPAPPAPERSTRIADDVEAVDDAALERFIAAERADPAAPDLLRPSAPKE